MERQPAFLERYLLELLSEFKNCDFSPYPGFGAGDWSRANIEAMVADMKLAVERHQSEMAALDRLSEKSHHKSFASQREAS